MSRIMIAGTKSGVGKTTVSMGLMAALSKRMPVQPFKVGPDYIDPAFHSFITGRESRNLDSYMMEEEMIRYLFMKNTQTTDMAILEGVMGLFDGAEVGSDIGTSASIAKILKTPVILVVDGSKVAASLAATVKGFEAFDKDLNLAGVIINNVGSKAHYDLLKRAIEYHTNVVPCGYLIKNSQVTLPERHLGLVPACELEALTKVFDILAQRVETTIDINRILEIAKKVDVIETAYEPNKELTEPVRIALAKDQAFNFYYQDSLELLEENYGVEWVPFSPLEDKGLPDQIHGLYLGGGFPEIFAKKLAENSAMKQDILEKLESGLPYVAECGGLMYLCDTLVDLEGEKHKMLGWLEGQTSMEKRLQRFGYAKLTLLEDGIYGKKGDTIKVHEFHRSKAKIHAKSVYQLEKIRNNEVIKTWTCGFNKKNGIAAYAHKHFASNMAFGHHFVKTCRDYKKRGYNHGVC